MDFLKLNILALTCLVCYCRVQMNGKSIPLVINTWNFKNGATTAWELVKQGKSALDAVEAGCSRCEDEQCDYTVGFGGSPDENGETTLDAMIMDGPTHDVGAVGALRRVKHAISVARKVLEHTEHTLLVGDQATQFALSMGFKEENLSTAYSIQNWREWKDKSCQPNFWKNVHPDPKISCGPYRNSYGNHSSMQQQVHPKKIVFDSHNHDTVGMIVIDKNNRIAAGTSSNGASHKIPGRVGDSPIPGSGAYVDQDVGGAAATGDGDVMMRFVPSFYAVENMRRGLTPTKAAEESIRSIIVKYPSFSGAIIAANMNGEYGAACHGIKNGFHFCVSNVNSGNITIKAIPCIDA